MGVLVTCFEHSGSTVVQIDVEIPTETCNQSSENAAKFSGS